MLIIHGYFGNVVDDQVDDKIILKNNQNQLFTCLLIAFAFIAVNVQRRVASR